MPRPQTIQIRSQLVTDGVLVQHGSHYVFTRDHLFASPSMAAMALTLARYGNCGMQ